MEIGDVLRLVVAAMGGAFSAAVYANARYNAAIRHADEKFETAIKHADKHFRQVVTLERYKEDQGKLWARLDRFEAKLDAIQSAIVTGAG